MSGANPATQISVNPDFESVASHYPSADATLALGHKHDPKDAVQKLLGNKLQFTAATSVNLDTKEGYAHSTTGIPYAISGTATVVSQKVGAWLAGFQDPIKAILGVGVHTNSKILIKRKYVVGGSATITPERAPARTVAIKEDVREVSLTRYGGDIEMNLNLFLRPGDAEEELEMKLDAQKRELERKLVDLGYMCLMQEGTPIIDAIIRSNPTMGAPTTAAEAKRYHATARRIYTNNIFGALNKHRFPIANLLSAARYASAYSTGTQKGSTLILPHGVPDLLRYARKENMVYSVSGLKNGSQGKIDMQLQGAYEDPSSGVSILIHHPTPTYEHGVAKPNISIESGGLTDESIVASEHPIVNYGVGDVTRTLWENEAYSGVAFQPPNTDDGSKASIVAATAADRSRPVTGNNFDPLRAPTGAWPTVTNTRTDAKIENETTLADVVNGGLLSTDHFQVLEHAQGEFSQKITALKRGNAFVEGTDSVDTLAETVFPKETAHPLTTKVTTLTMAAAAGEPPQLKVYRIARVVASSAILAAPGSQTGELLIGYPFTGVSTSHAEERMRIQLRCYLGAALYQPDNVLIMPNVFVEGIPDAVYYVEGESPNTVTATNAPAGSPDVAASQMFANRHSMFDSMGCYTHRGNSDTPVNWMEFGCRTLHPMRQLRNMDEYRSAKTGADARDDVYPNMSVTRDDNDVIQSATRMEKFAEHYVGQEYSKPESGGLAAWCGSSDRAQMMMWRELYGSMAVILYGEEDNTPSLPYPFKGPKTDLMVDDDLETENDTRTRRRDMLVREMTARHAIYACSPTEAERDADTNGSEVVPKPNTDTWRRGDFERKAQPYAVGSAPVANERRDQTRNPFMNVARCATVLSWLQGQFEQLPQAEIELLTEANCDPAHWAAPHPTSLSLSALVQWDRLNRVAQAVEANNKAFRAVPAMAGVAKEAGLSGTGRYFDSTGKPLSSSDANDLLGEWPAFGAQAVASPGATYKKAGSTVVQLNSGEFGELDHPTKYAILHGAPQAFEGGTVQVGSGAI